MVKTIRFTKMHGIGNDFALINALDGKINGKDLPIPYLANRHVGIGFDQLLVIEPSKRGPFFCRIFNADGSEAEQCGNGLRCVARFIHEEKLHDKNQFELETVAGIFPLEIKDYNHIRVALGTPQINEYLFELKVKQDPELIPVSILSLGNPHAIIKVESIYLPLADKLGPEVSTHVHFPHGANVGFMQIIDRKNIHLRTFERGVGETLACGSNACAAVVAGIINDWLDKSVTVTFRYGRLTIEWQGGDHPVYMTGPAVNVFKGEFGCD